MSQPGIGRHGGEPRPFDRNGDLAGMRAQRQASQFGGAWGRLQAFEFDSFELFVRPGQRRVRVQGLRLLKAAICCGYAGSAAYAVG